MTALIQPGPIPEPLPRDAWHEDMGDVLWWRFPVEEAPWVGSPLCSDWPGYHTHFTPLPPVPLPPGTPRRYQRSRARGMRIPQGAVCVDRSTRWGNPYRVGPDGPRDEVIEKYRAHLRAHPRLVAEIRAELAGRHVACYCRLDEPCHGDVILRVAAGEAP